MDTSSRRANLKAALLTPLKRAANRVTRLAMEEYQRTRKGQQIQNPIPTDDNNKPNATCALLDLPGELRNEIWKHSLTPKTRLEVDLFEGYAELYRHWRLLSCCEQIKEEVEGFFPAIRDQYLMSTRFVISAYPALLHNDDHDDRNMKEIYRRITAMRSFDLAKISRLKIECPISRYETIATCEFQNGSWDCSWLQRHWNFGQHSKFVLSALENREPPQGIPSEIPWIHLTERYAEILGPAFDFSAVWLKSNASEEEVRKVVEVCGSQRLTSERLRWMLVFQWVERVFSPLPDVLIERSD